MANNTIDITNLNKVDLLRFIWNASREAPTFGARRFVLQFNDTLAAELIGGYIDYFQGRTLGVDISEDAVDPFNYDHRYGQGALARIVDVVRQQQVPAE